MSRYFPVWLIAVAALAACSCDRKNSGATGDSAANGDSNMQGTQTKTIAIRSEAFAQGGAIPQKYTGEGMDVSPPLQWNGVPAGAKQLVLIVDDPDAPHGTFVHWVMYGIAPSATGLREGVECTPQPADPPGARNGKNGFETLGYKGPKPPEGKVHHYRFRLYALDVDPHLKPGMTKPQVLAMIQGHVLAEGELVGTYERK